MSIAPADPTLLALLDAAVYSRIEEQSTRSETWAGEEKIKEENKSRSHYSVFSRSNWEAGADPA